MGRLFWKIFLGFWLTVILAGGIVWLLAALTRPNEQPILERHLRFASKGLDGYAADALASLEQHGLRGWRDYKEKTPPEEPHPFIITSDLRPLSNAPLPPMVAHLARSIFETGEVRILKRRHRFAIGRPLQLPDGRDAALVLHFRLPHGKPGAGPPRWGRRFLGPDHRLGLVIFLLVAGAICLLLTRSLTGPIGQLRRATRDFAAGKLDTRVGDKLRGKNELSQLGVDFDRMAEQIESLVTGQQRLLRDISHELRSPLARLGVALELVRQHQTVDEAQSPLDRIEQESGRINDLIGQLLTLTRLEQAPEPATRQPIVFGDLLQQVIDDAAFEAEPRGIIIHSRGVTDAVLSGFPELLHRALDNIFRNAIRYSPDAGIIDVILEQQAQNWQLRICDQGPGVEDNCLPHLFEPFYRADSARTPGSGTGLGLAIAARAIARHEGQIRAANRSGGGLEIHILLPRN